jgi:hypothetical protein
MALVIMGVGLWSGHLWQVMAAPSPSTSSSANTNTLKEILKKTVEERGDQVKGATIEDARRTRGVVGEILRVTDTSVSVRSAKETLTISTEKLTVYRENKSIHPEDLVVGEWASVIGTQEGQSFTPTRMLVTPQSLAPAATELQLVSLEKMTKPPRTSTGIASNTPLSILTVRSRSDENAGLQNVELRTTTQLRDNEGSIVAPLDLKIQTQYFLVTIPNPKGGGSAAESPSGSGGTGASASSALAPTTAESIAVIVRALAPLK